MYIYVYTVHKILVKTTVYFVNIPKSHTRVKVLKYLILNILNFQKYN